MSTSVKLHLHHLDLEPGADIATVRKSYKDLTFIWHPDRHPEHLKDRAQAKLQAINEAYQFFNNYPEALDLHEDDDDFFQSLNKEKSETEAPKEVTISKQQCHRCHGSGKISTDVDWKGSFIQKECDVCEGVGHIYIDQRHNCKDCDGEGLNKNVNHEERQSWIDAKMKTLEWWKKNLKPVEYKKLWLQFHYDHLICGSCRGSGYSLYRKEFRKQERRLSCETDFLHHLNHSDKRSNDRRKPQNI